MVKKEASPQGENKYSEGFVPRPPDYNLGCYHKPTGAKGRVGSGWLNREDGSITIQINAFTVLPPLVECTLTLFLNEPRKYTKPEAPAKPAATRPAKAKLDYSQHMSGGAKDPARQAREAQANDSVADLPGLSESAGSERGEKDKSAVESTPEPESNPDVNGSTGSIGQSVPGDATADP